MFEKRRRAPAPRDEGLQQISDWHAWFVAGHAERLRSWPDAHTLEQERAKVAALATAITARMRADYLARTR